MNAERVAGVLWTAARVARPKCEPAPRVWTKRESRQGEQSATVSKEVRLRLDDANFGERAALTFQV